MVNLPEGADLSTYDRFRIYNRNGLWTLDHIRFAREDQRVILTGATLDSDVRDYVNLVGNVALLDKPYSVDDLFRLLET